MSEGDACRYPAEVVPFAAVAAPTSLALQQLHSLLAPGEFVWLIGENYPRVPELRFEETIECLQLMLPAAVVSPDPTIEIAGLSDANAAEMVALADLAFPGFFRRRTCEMGSYYGVRSDAELIAMSGERLMLEGYSEISGVCTHPAHRGQGLAASIIWRLVRDHRHDGLVSWLHVGAANRRALDLSKWSARSRSTGLVATLCYRSGAATRLLHERGARAHKKADALSRIRLFTELAIA